MQNNNIYFIITCVLYLVNNRVNRDAHLIFEAYAANKNKLLNEAFDPLDANLRPINADKLVDYINRVIDKSKLKASEKSSKGADYFHMPHIHPSVAKRVLISTPEGETVDIEQFKKILMKRPNELLRKNEKMQKSETLQKRSVSFYMTQT